MARRAAAINDDNLELLLDTMCNAFGGVIFIAMLLAVLAQFAEVQVKPDSPEMKTLERQRVELDGKLNMLRTTREQWGLMLAKFQEVVPLHEELEGLKKHNAGLEKDVEDLEKRGKEAWERVLATGTTTEADKEVRDLTQKAEGLIIAIGTAERGVTRERRLAKLQPGKSTFFLMVKWNRLFLLRKPTAQEPNGPINDADVDHRSEDKADGSTMIYYNPKEGRGIPLDRPGWQHEAGVKAILDHVPAEHYTLHFLVYPDSYAGVVAAVEFFLSEEYKHNWHVIPEEDFEPFIRTLAPGQAAPRPDELG